MNATPTSQTIGRREVLWSMGLAVVGGALMGDRACGDGDPAAGVADRTSTLAGIYNAEGHGAVGDGVTNDRAALDRLANTTIAAAGGIIYFVPGRTYRISSNTTFPANVELWFGAGAKLLVDAGVTVTINGSVRGGLSQLFSGDGSVALGANVPDVYDAWFGDDVVKAVDSTTTAKQRVHITQTALTGVITIAKSCHIVLDTDLVCASDAIEQFIFNGAQGATYTASAAAEAGDRVISLTSVSGLAVGEYLGLTHAPASATTYHHYRIDAISGRDVTLNRVLDLPLAVTAGYVKRYVPINVIFDGQGHTVTMTGARPLFARMNYTAHSAIRGIRFVHTSSHASSGIFQTVWLSSVYDFDAEDLHFRSFSIGDQHAHLAGYYSTDVRFRNCTVADVRGVPCRGIEAYYSTHVTVARCAVRGAGLTTVGGIFVFATYHYHVDGCEVSGSNATGIHDTYSWHGRITGCTVMDVSGDGHIYLNSGGNVAVLGNVCIQNKASGNNPMIHCRSGDGVVITGNTGRGRSGLVRLRNPRNVIVSNNVFSGPAEAPVIMLQRVATEPESVVAALIEGNVINVEGQTVNGDAIGITIDSSAHRFIKVRHNLIRIQKTSGTGSSFGIQSFLADPDSIIEHNDVELVSGGTAQYGIYVSSSTVRVRQNRVSPNVILAGPCPNVERFTDVGRFEVPTAPTLTNSWVNCGGAEVPAGYWKDREGVVHVRGAIKNGVMSAAAFTLPVGYRPAYGHTFATATDTGAGSVNLTTGGAVVPASGGTGYVFLLFSFRTD